jgi:hypothetical protein
MSNARRRSRLTRIAALAVYAIAMGWLEAVVVVYIRALTGLGHGADVPDPAGVAQHLRQVPWLIGTEQTRELATMVMLAAIGLAVARTWTGRFGAFLFCFGVWDISYYVALYALLRWPSSLATLDVLFLVPPSALWYQPVWVPVAISCVMIAGGAWMFLRSPSAVRPAAAATLKSAREKSDNQG